MFLVISFLWRTMERVIVRRHRLSLLDVTTWLYHHIHHLCKATEYESRLISGYAMEGLRGPKHGQCAQFESLHRRAEYIFFETICFWTQLKIIIFSFFFSFLSYFVLVTFFLLWMLCLYTNEAGLLPIPPHPHISYMSSKDTLCQ